jgi:colanic acid biosynthesis glycosyl transferase WcaI
VVRRTGGGLLVDPDSPAALAEGILSLYRDRNLARELGRRGAQGVREHYSVQHMASRALEVYRGVANPRVHA